MASEALRERVAQRIREEIPTANGGSWDDLAEAWRNHYLKLGDAAIAEVLACQAEQRAAWMGEIEAAITDLECAYQDYLMLNDEEFLEPGCATEWQAARARVLGLLEGGV